MSSTPATLAEREAARHSPLSPMGRGTLSRRLVLRVAALVAAVAIALSALSTLAVHRIMLNQLDDQLTRAVITQDKGPGHADNGGNGDEVPRGINMPGLPPGTAVVTNPTGMAPSSAHTHAGIVGNGQYDEVSLRAATELLEESASNQIRTVSISELGTFRAMKIQRTVTYASGATYQETDVVAVPTAAMQHAVNKLMGLEALLSLAAVGLSVFVSRAVVVRALRPLNRLATTATEVSNLALDRGEVALPMRVPGRDADPTSEVGRVGHAFNHMLNNVEGALASRQHSETKVRQFVADASHELRNPLAAIRGYAELTRRSQQDLPPDAAHAIGRIEAESTRMSRLVEDMLLLARLDNDPTLELAPTDVVELVLNAVSDAQVAGPLHDWGVDLPVDGRPVVAMADAQKLHQVVANLLANARKHTPAGTHVTVGVATEGPDAVISVVDDGPGIDPSIKDTLFERFARADVARAHNTEGSTGLGLAIVTAVMEAHGGSATVDSRPGHTCFTLNVPLAG